MSEAAGRGARHLNKMKTGSARITGVLVLAWLVTGCTAPPPAMPPAAPTAAPARAPVPTEAKIKFRWENIRPDGLRGPPEGLVSVAYEFCVPTGAEVYQEVRRIDSTVKISPGSRGRIGCSDRQALCIGNTHQRNWRDVLVRLASLPYVAEVRECFFE